MDKLSQVSRRPNWDYFDDLQLQRHPEQKSASRGRKAGWEREVMNEEMPRDWSQEQLRALADFLPLFEQTGFQFGSWHKSEQVRPGVHTLPQFELGETASSFVHTAYAQGWMLIGWNWPGWMKTEEARRLHDDPAALAAASAEQLAKLLTVLIRQDRFVEGGLNGAFESGLLTAIVRRAAVLAAS